MSTIANPSYRNRLGYQAMLLGGVCYIASFLLFGGNQTTAPLIEHHRAADQLAMLKQVLPAGSYDNDPLAEQHSVTAVGNLADPIQIMIARAGNTLSGAALLITAPGWGGDIELVMGVDPDGNITGVRVVSHKETPGLADKIELSKDDWITRFDGHSLANTPAKSWAVKKDGGDFDQFTGATITPRAMVAAVYAGLQTYQEWRHQLTPTASGDR